MRKRIKFYKEMIIEIIETLCTICLFLDAFGRRNHIPHAEHFHSHFDELKMYSAQLREEQFNSNKQHLKEQKYD